MKTTVNREIVIMLKLFRGINFRSPLPGTLTLIMRMRLKFTCLIFVSRTDYENILTAKISRFTVCPTMQEIKNDQAGRLLLMPHTGLQ